jgi:parallel beta-helix repeat protein
LKRKWLAVGIILLFVGTCIVPTTAQNTDKPQSQSRGNWLYVGGSGPGNYTKIQDAVDNASDGDTVFVYDDSSPYIEYICIGKALTLRGEDKNTTVIEGYVHLTASKVTLCNFTFQKADWTGIEVSSSAGEISDVVIVDNIIKLTINGIAASYASLNIKRNIIEDNFRGVSLQNSYAIIEYNIIHHNSQGISAWAKEGTLITHNDIRFSQTGIGVGSSSRINILNNNLQENEYGIFLYNSKFIVIKENNFIDNSYLNANFFNLFLVRWIKNYWDDWDNTGLYKIPGQKFPGTIFSCRWYNFDFHPAQEPYDIPGMS